VAEARLFCENILRWLAAGVASLQMACVAPVQRADGHRPGGEAWDLRGGRAGIRCDRDTLLSSADVVFRMTLAVRAAPR